MLFGGGENVWTVWCEMSPIMQGRKGTAPVDRAYHVLSILRVRLIGALDENRSILITFHKHSVHENIHSYVHEFIFYNA